MIPDECGECATNSGFRAKCTPSGKSLCVQAVKPLCGWSFLFACGVRRMRTLADRTHPPCAAPACLDASQDGRLDIPTAFAACPRVLLMCCAPLHLDLCAGAGMTNALQFRV